MPFSRERRMIATSSGGLGDPPRTAGVVQESIQRGRGGDGRRAGEPEIVESRTARRGRDRPGPPSALRARVARSGGGRAPVLSPRHRRGRERSPGGVDRPAARRILVRREDRRDGGLPRDRRRGGALAGWPPHRARRADVRGRRNALRVPRIRNAPLRQRRDAPGRDRPGGAAARRRGARPRRAAAAPLGPGKALRRPRNHRRGQRPRSRRSGAFPRLPAETRPTPPHRGLAPHRRGLRRRGGRVAAAILRRGLARGLGTTGQRRRRRFAQPPRPPLSARAEEARGAARTSRRRRFSRRAWPCRAPSRPSR